MAGLAPQKNSKTIASRLLGLLYRDGSNLMHDSILCMCSKHEKTMKKTKRATRQSHGKSNDATRQQNSRESNFDDENSLAYDEDDLFFQAHDGNNLFF